MTSGSPYRPDLTDLDLFLAVAVSGSIGQVAAERGLSQPTVSRRMASLERQLRVRLLTRSTQGTALTAAGKVVVDWAETLLSAADDFERAVGSLRHSREATVRAGVSLTIAEHYAPAWLARLQESAPDVVVSLVVHNSTEVIDLLDAGEVEIGFVETPRLPRRFRHRRVGWDRLAVAVPPTHPWAQRARSVSVQELAAGPFLLRETGSGTLDTLRAALEDQGLELTAGTMLGSNSALRSAALAGLGAVALPRVALQTELESGRLVEVATPDLNLRRPLTALWRADAELSPAAVDLLLAVPRPRGTSSD